MATESNITTATERTTSSTAESTQEDRLRLWVPEPIDPGLSVEHVSPDSELGDRAEQFVYETYRVSGFCKESPRKWVEETDQWRAGSILHVISDRDEILGVIRTMVGGFEELPASQFPPTVEMGGRLLEGGSLAVKPDHRGMGIANELHRIIFQRGIEERVDGWCMLIDAWMADFLRTYYAFPTVLFSDRRAFMGGEIEPIVVWADELLVEMSGRRPKVYQHAVSRFTPEQMVEFDLPIVLD